MGIFDYCPTEREREREREIYNEIVGREVGLVREREKKKARVLEREMERGGDGTDL